MRCVRCVFVFLICISAGLAVAQTTTGRIIGTVVDEQGAPLAGVAVAVQSEVLIGGVKTEITDDRGEFAILGLPPGVYQLRADLDGFVSQEWQELKVRLGRAAAVSIEMAGGTFSEVVQVVGETPVIDPTQVNMEQVFDANYLRNATIGAAGRGYQSVLEQAAGADYAGEASGNPSVFGSTAGENAYYIDGVDTTDGATSTFGANFNFDAVQEIQFQTGGFEAEYGRAIGGVVNLVTKSGGNQFSGTLDARYRDDSFYESGDHFDSNLLDNEMIQVGATLGGPIVRDKLWFFAAYDHVDNEFSPVGASGAIGKEGGFPFLKLSWQIDPGWRLVAKYQSDPLDITNANASSFTAAEAHRFQEQGGDIFSAELNAVLSDTLLWNTVVGINRGELNSGPQDGDYTTPGHYNFGTGETYINYESWVYAAQSTGERNRDDLTTDLTFFADDFIKGSHEFKFGVEYGKPMFKDSAGCSISRGGERCEAGVVGETFWDHVFLGYNHAYMWDLRDQGAPQSFDGTMYTGFVQDAWRPIPNLTIKAGLRFDEVGWADYTGTEVVTLDKLQPRIGFAYDITGDAKNLIRASWGRFMHPANLSVPGFLSQQSTVGERFYSCSSVWGPLFGFPISTAEDCQAVADLIGREYRMDADGWDPLGWIWGSQLGGGEPTKVDPDLRATYGDEWNIAYERQIWDRSSIEISYIHKETKDGLEDTCEGNFLDPPPHEDAECGSYLIYNPTGRQFSGATVRFETRTVDWLTLLASYTYSHSRGNADTYGYFKAEWDEYPWDFMNLQGYLMNQVRHRVKVNGFVLLPYDFTIGVDAWWNSPFVHNAFADSADFEEIPPGYHPYWEPRGSREGNETYQLDLQVSKGFTVGAVRLELIATVLNVFSTERPLDQTDVCESYGGCADPEGPGLVPLGAPTNWQTPRRYELGFRIEF